MILFILEHQRELSSSSVAVSVVTLSLSVLAPSCKVVRRCCCVFLLEPL